jgi:hypothetical protein
MPDGYDREDDLEKLQFYLRVSFLAVSMSLMDRLLSLRADLSTIVFAYGSVMTIFNWFIKNRLVSMMTRTA